MSGKGKDAERWDVRSDEELVLNVDEVFRQLNGYSHQYSQRKVQGNRTFEVSILDRMFNTIRCAKGPRTSRAAYLHLAGAGQTKLSKLCRPELRGWEDERHLSRMALQQS